MKTTQEILSLLDQLENHIADDFEDQELDFKEWNEKSNNDAVNLAIKMAVCMANGGGGMIVFGIKDKVNGRAKAVKGVPPIVDSVLLQKSIYDRTEPHITASFEWVNVPEGHAYSGANWTPEPELSGHYFRLLVDTCTGDRCTYIPDFTGHKCFWQV